MQKRWLMLSLLGLLLLLAAGCGTATTSKPKDKVLIRLDWLPSAYHALFHIGAVKGFYADQGIDVDIQDGKGSATTINLVATKAEMFGFADGGTMVRGIATGQPVKMVAAMFRQGGLAVWGRADKGIKTPKDLEGKTVGIIPGEGGSSLFPAFLAMNGLDPNKVKTTSLDYATGDRLVLDGKADAGAFGWHYYTTQYKIMQNADVTTLAYYKYGLPMVGAGLIVHNDTIKEKPDLVKRVVAATIKSWEYGRDHQEEARDAHFKQRADEQRSRDLFLALLKEDLNLLDSPRTKGKRLGLMDKDDWQFTIDTMAKYTEFKGTPPKVDDVFTNEFLPK